MLHLWQGLLCFLSIGLCVMLTACRNTPSHQTYTIGIVNYVPILAKTIEGFKERMAELGYLEGKNVTYVYQGMLPTDAQVIEREVQRLIAQRVDLLLTLGTLPTLAAKKYVEGTKIPVVFAPLVNPVEEGVVQSLSHPGGNITGVQNGDTIPKAIEWMRKIVPHTTRIHVIYHPQDQVARTSVKPLPSMAASLGIELVLDEVASREDAIALIEQFAPQESIFFVPTPRLGSLVSVLEVAARSGIATGSQNLGWLEEGALFIYGIDSFMVGRQAARLAEQIFKGIPPADLPVETGEYALRLNLRTAKTLSLDIPETIMRQASTILR